MKDVTHMEGIDIDDLHIGSGNIAMKDSIVTVKYTLSLNRGGVVQKDVEATFSIADRKTIPGLRYGIQGMSEGGRRMLRVSPHLGYGETGVVGKIPPNAVLVFEVELLKCANSRQT